jgi:hypothetical protein
MSCQLSEGHHHAVLRTWLLAMMRLQSTQQLAAGVAGLAADTAVWVVCQAWFTDACHGQCAVDMQ